MKIQIWKAKELLEMEMSYLKNETLKLTTFNEENLRKLYEYRGKVDIINSFYVRITDDNIKSTQSLIRAIEVDYDLIKSLSAKLESSTSELNLYENINLIQYKVQLVELENLLQRLEDDDN